MSALRMDYRLVYRCRLCGETFERAYQTPHPAGNSTVLARHLAAFEGVTGVAHTCPRMPRHAGLGELVGLRDATPASPAERAAAATVDPRKLVRLGPAPLQNESTQTKPEGE